MSTKDRFMAAIKGAPSLATAVNLTTAIHLANLKELLSELQDKINANTPITSSHIEALAKEYGV